MAISLDSTAGRHRNQMEQRREALGKNHIAGLLQMEVFKNCLLREGVALCALANSLEIFPCRFC